MAARKTAQKKQEQKNKKEETASESESGIESGETEEETISEGKDESGSEDSASQSEEDSAESTTANEQEEEAVAKGDGTPEEERTIFIKGLQYTVTEESLSEFFARCGEIKEVRIPQSKEAAGRGKGFAYIEFALKQSCEAALELSNTEFEGRQIFIDMANSNQKKDGGAQDRETGRRQESYSAGNDKDEEITVFLGNVPFEFDRDDLLGYLKKFANVKDLRVPTERETGRPKGFAFASFDSHQEAEKLIASDLVFQDRNLRAQRSEKRAGGSGPRRDGGRGNQGFGKRAWSSENSSNKKHVKFE